MKKLTIAFDINRTLTEEVIRRLFQALDRSKCEVIVWSTQGRAYCEAFCAEYNLRPDRIVEKHSEKVDIAVDDLPGNIHQASVVLGVNELM